MQIRFWPGSWTYSWFHFNFMTRKLMIRKETFHCSILNQTNVYALFTGTENTPLYLVMRLMSALFPSIGVKLEIHT